MNEQNLAGITASGTEMPKTIFLASPDYQLNKTKDCMQINGQDVPFLGAIDRPDTVTVTAGGFCELAVWGWSEDRPVLVSCADLWIECLEENGDVSAEDNDTVSAGVANFLSAKLGAAPVVQIAGQIVRRKGPKKALATARVRVSLRSNPDVYAEVLVRVVHPVALYVLPDCYAISDSGTAVVRVENGHPSDIAINPDQIDSEYYVPLLGEDSKLNIVAYCSDDCYRYLRRSELKQPEWGSREAQKFLSEGNDYSARANTFLSFKALQATDKSFAVTFTCESNPRITTKITLKVAVPQRLAVRIDAEGSPLTVSPDGLALIREDQKLDDEAVRAFGQEAATIGVGEELPLQVFACFSDKRWRALNWNEYLVECFATTSDGQEVPTDALRANCNTVLATSHIPEVSLVLRVSPRFLGDCSRQGLVEQVPVRTLVPVKAYLAREGRDSNLGFSPWHTGKSEALLRDDTPTFTLGVGDECAIDLVARYEDGSLRRVSPHGIKLPRYTGEREIGYTHSPIEEFLSFRQVRALVVEGKRDFRGNFDFVTGIIGTHVDCTFKIAVSKIKKLHFVPWPAQPVLEFSSHGRPLDEAGREIADIMMLDDASLELRVGETCRFTVMCEYANGAWGICNHHRFFVRCTQGIDLCCQGVYIATPNEYVRKSSKVRAVLYSNRMTNAEMEMRLVLPVQLRLVVANPQGEYTLSDGDDDSIVEMELDEKRAFAVLAIYEDNSVQRLLPGEYMVMAIGAGLRVWDGRRDAGWIKQLKDCYSNEYGRRRKLSSTWQASPEEGQDVCLEATKRTRRERVVELIVRLALRPSVCSVCKVNVR